VAWGHGPRMIVVEDRQNLLAVERILGCNPPCTAVAEARNLAGAVEGSLLVERIHIALASGVAFEVAFAEAFVGRSQA